MYRKQEVGIMLQPEFNAVTGVKKVSAEVKKSVEVSSLLTEEIKKPVSVSAEAYIISREKGENETAATAKAVFHFVYLAEEGYKKAEMSAEVNAKIPLGNAYVTAHIEDPRIISVSEGYVAKANVIFKGEAEKAESKNALVGGDGVFIKEFTEEYDAYTGVSEGTTNLEDEFEVDYAVSEVLTHVESVNLNEVKSGISSVIFDGEATIELCLLPLTENGDIMRERRKIPFRYEMENVGALPDMRAYGNAEIKRVAVKVTADEAKGKSNIITEMVLGFSGEAVESVAVTLAEDAYSKTNTVNIRKEKTERVKYIGQFVFSEKIVTLAEGEIPDGGRYITVLGENLTVISTETHGGKIKATGSVGADVVFKNSDNGVTVVSAEAPFDVETDVVGDAETVRVSLSDFSAKVKNGSVEFEFTVRVIYRLYDKKEFDVISEIVEGEERPISKSTITIYIPSEGDGIWEIAKQLGESEEDVRKYNPDLVFPLSEKDRIVIYRQKI